MHLARFWRHVRMTPWSAARCFPSGTLDAIQAAVAAGEKRHRGQVRFVVEAELTTAQLWRELGSRERAREVFAFAGVWNTEENVGVLVYVLLADHKVEVVADRGIDAKVSAHEWREVCARMERAYREERFEAGSIEGVNAIAELLAMHFPAQGERANELPDRPAMI